MTIHSDPMHGSMRAKSDRHCLDPMRGIFVSLGLGTAGWLLVAAMALALRALVS